MPRISIQAVSEYLQSLYDEPVRLVSLTEQGRQESSEDLKAFGVASNIRKARFFINP